MHIRPPQLPHVLLVPPEPRDPATRRSARTPRATEFLAQANPVPPGPSPAPSPAQGGSSPGPGTPSPTTGQDNTVHSAGGHSGLEHEVDLQDVPDDPSDPEEPPNTPLADEKRAVVVYAARNLNNTVDTRPLGTAWFSA